VLTIGTLSYLAALPFGWLSYRNYERQATAAAAPAVEQGKSAELTAYPDAAGRPRPIDEPERPGRLN
jgi:hypothetical protein